MNNTPSGRLAALCSVCALMLCAHVQAAETRGELLYAMHCSACHSAQIHWREQRLVTNWGSLLTQVRRWQAASKLLWSSDEILDVARYLNAHYYRFPESGHKGYSQHDNPALPDVE